MQFPFHNVEKRKKILFLRPFDIFMQYKRQDEILKQVEIGFKNRKFMKSKKSPIYPYVYYTYRRTWESAFHRLVDAFYNFFYKNRKWNPAVRSGHIYDIKNSFLCIIKKIETA